MPRRFRLLALVAAFVACAPGVAAASAPRGLAVDPAGKGGRCDDGRPVEAVSARTPWCTLARAASAAPAGATVLLRSGAYPRLTLSDRDLARPVTFRPYPGEHPTLDGVTLERVGGVRFVGLRFVGGNLLTDVSDFAFVDDEVGLHAAGPDGPTAFVVTGARHGLWSHVHMHDAWSGIAFRWGGADDLTIRDNTFEDLGNAGVHLQFAHDVTITRNRFIRVRPRADMSSAAHSDAVHVVGPDNDGILLAGNRVSEGRGFLLDPDAGVAPGTAIRNVVVRDNVFAGPDFAVRAFGTPGIRITDNTVWGPNWGPGNGIDLRAVDGVSATTTGVMLDGNIIRRLNVEPGVTFASRQDNLVAQGDRLPADREAPMDLFASRPLQVPSVARAARLSARRSARRSRNR